MYVRVRACVFVCVCVRERERERERKEVYFKELGHLIVRTSKIKTCRAGCRLET